MNGDFAQALSIWSEIAGRWPGNPRPHFAYCLHALRDGRSHEALSHWTRAFDLGGVPGPMFSFVRAVLAAAGNDVPGELQALDAALEDDAYFLPALLRKAAVHERLDKPRTAARIYRNCLRIASSRPEAWPEDLSSQLAHAKAVVQRNAESFFEHLSRCVGDAIDCGPEKGRWREAAAILAGVSTPSLSNSNQLYVPRLPAIPFYGVDLFPWASAVEGAAESIRAEFLALHEDTASAFGPYIRYARGEPVNQWAELNHSPRWRTLALWQSGARMDTWHSRCPITSATLQAVDLAEIDGLCPNVMFSVLAPHTQIPPHHGETNARLVVHLPLIVPPACSFRVGFETRAWQEGKLLIFDDTLEHTARNDSNDDRVVLIFDVWNPMLSLDERDVVRRLAIGARSFRD
ncbi:MAG: aspartyl/asparaginyl beta-hydroxylase domain-containing protein [Alphaproteobacteria bacterium]|nr:aspartyl/asparaginyl beta-hydroxylase domain-containing protein [Alphaproteobacteria bacterium]